MRNSAPLRTSSYGFTLIEIMVVVAVLAILAAVAMPNYFESVRKSRRAEAITALSTIAQRQENWRSNNAQYTLLLADLGASSPTPSGYYNLSLSVPAGASSSVAFMVTATRVVGGAQAGDARCGDFSLAASAGQYSYTSTGTLPAQRCWSR
jgi:type IV pilus assembly protein PilE